VIDTNTLLAILLPIALSALISWRMNKSNQQYTDARTIHELQNTVNELVDDNQELRDKLDDNTKQLAAEIAKRRALRAELMDEIEKRKELEGVVQIVRKQNQSLKEEIGRKNDQIQELALELVDYKQKIKALEDRQRGRDNEKT